MGSFWVLAAEGCGVFHYGSEHSADILAFQFNIATQERINVYRLIPL